MYSYFQSTCSFLKHKLTVVNILASITLLLFLVVLFSFKSDLIQTISAEQIGIKPSSILSPLPGNVYAPNTPTPTPSPTPTPTPTPTPSPTPTPTPLPPSSYDDLMNRYASQYSVDVNLLKKIALCESGYNSNAVYGPYAGMYQFTADTWSSTRTQMGLDTNPDLRFNGEESIKTAAFKISQGGANDWPACSR